MKHVNYEIVKKAMSKKQQILGVYDGYPREFCPHALGSKKGRPQALFYQFGGDSGSRPIEPTGSPNNWRCIPIEEMVIISVRDGEWHTASNHSRASTCLDIVDVEVNRNG